VKASKLRGPKAFVEALIMNDGRVSEVAAALRATYIQHLLRPSKMPNSGARPDDVARHASHVGLLFLPMECKGRGWHCCPERDACSTWS
jgi:hypothetical protein